VVRRTESALLIRRIAIAGGVLLLCGAQASRVRSVTLKLKPHTTSDTIDYIDAVMVIKNRGFASGEILVRMPLVVASIPTQRYDAEALTAHDAQGALSLSKKDGEPTSFGTQRDWISSRATSGPVTITFTIVPRRVDADTRSGPLFDVRVEGRGVDGAGMTFVPAPTDQNKYRLSLDWDLSTSPPGSRAVSCHGDGNASWTGDLESLAGCYYAVGPLKVFPDGDLKNRQFGIYWLVDPPFDIQALASQIQKLFKYMSGFFHDAGGSYRVFIRKNPYDSGGGTALERSFMFGWSAQSAPTVEHLEDLLAHEMTHNWPLLAGEHVDTSWYAEGNAEYYSILLSWRAGVINADEFLQRINGRAARYYQNPLQNLTNQQAEERYWQEANASYVPYGRGWMYLARTDAEIREHSGGKRTLDDLVVPLAVRRMHGDTVTVADWVALVTRELGPQATTEYEQMIAGTPLIPPVNAFGPCFKPTQYQTKLNQLGFDAKSLTGTRKIIHGVLAGSNAALTGVQDGDEVIRHSRMDQDEPNREITLTLRRDGVERDIKFLPVGQDVTGYRWVRVPGIPDSRCHY